MTLLFLVTTAIRREAKGSERRAESTFFLPVKVHSRRFRAADPLGS